MEEYSVAVVGATGAVGEELLKILHERKFPMSQLVALASSRSVGKLVNYGGQQIAVADLNGFDFSNFDIALFSAGSSVSDIYAPLAAKADCVVVDNTSRFRQEPDVPLIIPEVNPEALDSYKKKNIIANPNCSTIQMLMALKPLHDFSPIKRVIVSTYQAVSGTGNDAIEELKNQSAQVLGGQLVTANIYSKQIAFNVLPEIDILMENGYTKEEIKMHEETRKILENYDISVTATAVRVPVFNGHSEAVLIETETPISPKKADELLKNAPGISVVNSNEDFDYPTAVTDGSGKDNVFVGRIRTDLSNKNGLWLWIVGDNLKKGAALNSVQIAELLVRQGLKPKS